MIHHFEESRTREEIKVRLKTIGALGLLLGVVGTGIGIGAATAAGAVDAVPVGPKLYTESEVGGVWMNAARAFPEALPAGYTFVASVPSFFSPAKADPEEVHLFEEGLVESVMAAHWRCAWLEELVAAKDQGDQSRAAQASSALSGYEQIPASRAGHPEFNAYQLALDELAKTEGISAEELELKFDCTGVWKEGQSS